MRLILRHDRDSIPDDLKDLSRWPTIDTTLLDDQAAERVNRLLNAVQAYMQGLPVQCIADKAGITRQRLHHIVRGCLAEHSDGRIWGFRALSAYRRQRPYHRIAPIDGSRRSQHGGAAGALAMLFAQYPDIRKAVDGYFLKQLDHQLIHESRMPVKAVHKRFVDACRSAGLTVRQYPFNTKHRARRALAKYLLHLFKTDLNRAVKARHGAEASRSLTTAPADEENTPTRPYQRVEFDGHRLDMFCIIELPNPYGGVQAVTLDRLWLLLITDVKTRAILGYLVSLSPEYSSDDVLQCVKHALTPWKPLPLSIPGLSYHKDGGLPSGVFSECAGALWDELWFDNAKANLSKAVVTTLTRVVGCAVNAGPVKTPQRRPHVERLFQTLEENGFHRLPSTTGNGQDDPRRDNPEAAAVRWKITYQHLIELIDVMIAKYNAEPHAGIGYRSPLEALQYFIIHEGCEMRTLPDSKRQNLALLNMRVVRRIRGDVKQGKCPFVEFEGVHYTNDVLRRSPDLIKEKLTLLVDPQDLRCMTGYLDTGQELGVLTAHGFWSRTPHTLLTRKAINNLRLRKEIFYTDSDDPIMVYMDYLNEKAVTSKRARGQSVKIRTTLDVVPSAQQEEESFGHSESRQNPSELYTPAIRKTRLY